MKTVIFEILISIVFTNKQYLKYMQLFTVKSVGVSIQVKQIYSEGIPFYSIPLLGLFLIVFCRGKNTLSLYINGVSTNFQLKGDGIFIKF